MDLNKFRKLKSPYVIILVGPPLSGKTVFCNKFIETIDDDVTIISRDQIMMDLNGPGSYSDAFNKADREVNKILYQKLISANKQKENVIIDMTHMFSKRRRIHLNYFSKDYQKIGVIFPLLSDEEYIERNSKRVREEDKNISLNVIHNLISSYQTIKDDEGFDKIISL